MKFYPTKHLFYFAILIFLTSCIITACTKKDIPVDTSHTIGPKDTTSLANTDSITFYSPADVAVDAVGNIYVADYGNDLIRKITPAGLVSTLAGGGVQGDINATGALASFNRPSGVAVDANGNVYVADQGNSQIREITPAGLVTTLAGGDTTGTTNGPGASATFFNPTGVTVDPKGNVYVADAGNNLIRLINTSGIVSTYAGSITDTTQSVFNNPTGVAADALGNVFVANYLNSNILSINASGTINVLAGTGAQGSANGPANAATFFFPSNVAVDAAENIYVADEVNNLIRKITPDGTVSTLAGSGVAGATDSTGTAASFNGPAGVAVDAAGNVYVADANNNLIRKITPAGVVTTVAGNGQAGYQNGQAVARRNRKILRATARKLNMFSKPKGGGGRSL